MLSVTSVPPCHSCQQTLSFGVLENQVRSLLSMRGQEPITSNQLLAWHVARVYFEPRPNSRMIASAGSVMTH